jgi:hypothetical protein
MSSDLPTFTVGTVRYRPNPTKEFFHKIRYQVGTNYEEAKILLTI